MTCGHLHVKISLINSLLLFLFIIIIIIIVVVVVVISRFGDHFSLFAIVTHTEDSFNNVTVLLVWLAFLLQINLADLEVCLKLARSCVRPHQMSF